jgi:hypothetical protein
MILSFNLVRFFNHRVVMEFHYENQYLGREDHNFPIFGFPCSIVAMNLWVDVSLTEGAILD